QTETRPALGDRRAPLRDEMAARKSWFYGHRIIETRRDHCRMLRFLFPLDPDYARDVTETQAIIRAQCVPDAHHVFVVQLFWNELHHFFGRPARLAAQDGCIEQWSALQLQHRPGEHEVFDLGAVRPKSKEIVERDGERRRNNFG